MTNERNEAIATGKMLAAIANNNDDDFVVSDEMLAVMQNETVETTGNDLTEAIRDYQTRFGYIGTDLVMDETTVTYYPDQEAE